MASSYADISLPKELVNKIQTSLEQPNAAVDSLRQKRPEKL